MFFNDVVAALKERKHFFNTDPTSFTINEIDQLMNLLIYVGSHRAHRLWAGPVPFQLIRVEVLERGNALEEARVGAVLHAERIHLAKVAVEQRVFRGHLHVPPPARVTCQHQIKLYILKLNLN